MIEDLVRVFGERGDLAHLALLLWALAASGALPFAKEAFHATIRAGGKGAEASLRAFDAAYDRTLKGENDKVSATPRKRLEALPTTAQRISAAS